MVKFSVSGSSTLSSVKETTTSLSDQYLLVLISLSLSFPPPTCSYIVRVPDAAE